MLPSEKLRLLISKLYNIDLEKYAWTEKFKRFVFSIKLDKDLESNATTLGEIYQHGFNIGHCGLTSRYVIRNLKNSNLQYGITNILKGTKASPNGEHAWIISNNILIDTTLMICIPITKMNELGYIPQKTIEKESACMLSEYDVFDNEFNELNKNPNYKDTLFEINR